MKKILLFFTAFMLLGLVAKAQENGIYLIINEKTGKALTHGSNYITQTTVRNGQANQEWRITLMPFDGVRTLSRADDGIPNVGINVQILYARDGRLKLSRSPQTTANIIIDASWNFERQGNGNYCITRSGMAIDIPRGKSDEGLEPITYKINRDDNQRFRLQKIR